MTRAQSTWRTNTPSAFLPCIVVMVALLVSIGCKESEPAPTPATPEPKASRTTASDDSALMRSFIGKNNADGGASTGATLPAGHPAVPGMTSPPPKADVLPDGHPPLPAGMKLAGAKPAAAIDPGDLPLKYAVPDSWGPEAPASSMRKAQYLLPREDGDPSDGDMVLFFFGVNQGGPIEANIDRWVGQFSTADGDPIPDSGRVVKTEERNGLTITTLDVAGHYVNTMAPGGGSQAKEAKRMLAAIVETPGGRWFFKGTGPVNTMAKHKSAFDAMLATLEWDTTKSGG